MSEKCRRVLIVEDEMMVAMLIEDMLGELGYEVVGVAMRLEAALSMARDADIDIAVLDVNLADELSFPVAEMLLGRKIPFVFATGYGRRGLDGQFPDVAVIDKPFNAGHLQRALQQALA